jgi:hypothetical protein
LPTAGEKPSLARRVRDYLHSEDILLGKIPPKKLLEKTVRADEKEKPVEEIFEAFLKYPQLPMLESDLVVREAIVQGVNAGIFGVRSGTRVYFKEPVPPSVVEYGAVLVREPSLPPPPPPPPPEKGRITAEEILHAIGSSEVLGVRDVCEHLWQRRGKEFSSQKKFQEEFKKALLDGRDRRVFEVEAPVAAENLDWPELLAKARIKKSVTPPPPPPPPGVQTYTLRAKIPWDKLSDFVRGVVTPLRNDGAELSVEVTLEARSQPGGFKKSTLDQKVNETLKQIGAEIRGEPQH